jgi:4-amino-4-deoxy-L-arabinose transferase-like glycosyltransferase
LLSQVGGEGQFLTHLFVGGLLLRMVLGTVIYIFNLQDFFGGDALTYDFFGDALIRAWDGDRFYQTLVDMYTGGSGGGGWGMLYLVAGVYRLIGRNMLAIQFVNAVVGAATAPIIYYISHHIFGNTRVARIAALFTAFFPSLILWSSQGLKDGPIVFLLALSTLATLKLGEKLNLKYLVVLIFSLLALFSMRFYIFYLMAAAIGGAFVIGMRPMTAQSFVRQFLIIIAIGLAFTYFGMTRFASTQIENYGNLEAVQRSRLDAAQTGKSGFAKEADVSTASGALSAIPVGMTYLLFAPFPWQLASLRQSITLPEMIVWWLSFPLLILGLWFTIKYRLRQVSPILLFTSMLTFAYSLFQGNVGTAYRQRSQLLIFYFIFIAVGYVLFMEKREDKKRRQALALQEQKDRLLAVRGLRTRTQTLVVEDETGREKAGVS